jgi:DNA invertase Pin-like site-specific DNA recombinase
MKKAITYYRVSTERQGTHGLGLGAQKQAVQEFAKANGFMLTSEFIEVESGKRNQRPLLSQALTACKNEQATLLIARLDRLGRNVAFISKLMEAGVDFKAVDNPYAGKLIVHIMAAFAEHERDLISERTIAALKVAKARGIELGKYGRHVLSVENKQNADSFAASLVPVFDELNQAGFTTVRAMAAELNRRQVEPYRKQGQWHPSTIWHILKRLKTIKT